MLYKTISTIICDNGFGYMSIYNQLLALSFSDLDTHSELDVLSSFDTTMLVSFFIHFDSITDTFKDTFSNEINVKTQYILGQYLLNNDIFLNFSLDKQFDILLLAHDLNLFSELGKNNKDICYYFFGNDNNGLLNKFKEKIHSSSDLNSLLELYPVWHKLKHIIYLKIEQPHKEAYSSLVSFQDESVTHKLQTVSQLFNNKSQHLFSNSSTSTSQSQNKITYFLKARDRFVSELRKKGTVIDSNKRVIDFSKYDIEKSIQFLFKKKYFSDLSLDEITLYKKLHRHVLEFESDSTPVFTSKHITTHVYKVSPIGLVRACLYQDESSLFFIFGRETRVKEHSDKFSYRKSMADISEKYYEYNKIKPPPQQSHKTFKSSKPNGPKHNRKRCFQNPKPAKILIHEQNKCSMQNTSRNKSSAELIHNLNTNLKTQCNTFQSLNTLTNYFGWAMLHSKLKYDLPKKSTPNKSNSFVQNKKDHKSACSKLSEYLHIFSELLNDSKTDTSSINSISEYIRLNIAYKLCIRSSTLNYNELHTMGDFGCFLLMILEKTSNNLLEFKKKPVFEDEFNKTDAYEHDIGMEFIKSALIQQSRTLELFEFLNSSMNFHETIINLPIQIPLKIFDRFYFKSIDSFELLLELSTEHLSALLEHSDKELFSIYTQLHKWIPKLLPDKHSLFIRFVNWLFINNPKEFVTLIEDQLISPHDVISIIKLRSPAETAESIIYTLLRLDSSIDDSHKITFLSLLSTYNDTIFNDKRIRDFCIKNRLLILKTPSLITKFKCNKNNFYRSELMDKQMLYLESLGLSLYFLYTYQQNESLLSSQAFQNILVLLIGNSISRYYERSNDYIVFLFLYATCFYLGFCLTNKPEDL